MDVSAGVIILGASHWHTPRHVEALQAADIPIAATHDADPVRASAWADRTGAAPYSDWAEALDAHPGAVALVLVDHRSAPEVLTGLVTRKRAFALEKPGVLSAAHLAPILDAVRAENIATAVPFVNRFSPFWSEARRLGLMEHWDYGHFHVIGGPPQRYMDDGVEWVLDPDISGGGALRNLGIHAADAVRLLAPGQELTVCDAVISVRMHGHAVEDYAAARLMTGDGRVVTIEAGYAMAHESGSDKELRLLGRDAAIVERPGRIAVTAGGQKTQIDAPGVLAHYNHFARDVAGLFAGRDGTATLADLHAALQIVDAVYAVAAQGREFIKI